MKPQAEYDVVICGGGMAGLTLARHLKLVLPDLSVALIDRLQSPLPEAAHKVGESSIELATYYLGKVLDLDSYFRERHLPKLGLRFFFGDSLGPFEERPELGPSLFPPVPSYQIDRGRLENDLRSLVKEMGVALVEGTIVDDIILSESGAPHQILCRTAGGRGKQSIKGRWVVDAMGRRRFLQSRLGLKEANGHSASAAWWRIDKRLDVSEMGQAEDQRWQRRNVEDRFFSTNHLMGAGYWVWLIPLSSGATSVGIVTDEAVHPFGSYGKSYQHAVGWLGEHEPSLHDLLRGHAPLDFHGLKNYSYHSKQLYSHRRWSCVGEAGLFLDPLYSLGADFIATGNTITVELIRRDIHGELNQETTETFNRLILQDLAPLFLAFYENTYSAFGHAHIFTAKLAWDTSVYWSTLAPLVIQGHILDPSPEVTEMLGRYRALNARVQKLFVDWAARVPPRAPSVELADLTRMPLLQLLHLDLTARRSKEQYLAVAQMNLDRFEELAQVLFWQAIGECKPEQLARADAGRPWLNAWSISLDPERWNVEGLFAPPSSPRSLRPMRDTFAGIFASLTLRERILIEPRYRLLHFFGGVVNYRLVAFLHRIIFNGRSATWPRRLFLGK